MVICAWCTDGAILGRWQKVLEMLRAEGITPYALQINADGSPKHPLYISYSRQPQPMDV